MLASQERDGTMLLLEGQANSSFPRLAWRLGHEDISSSSTTSPFGGLAYPVQPAECALPKEGARNASGRSQRPGGPPALTWMPRASQTSFSASPVISDRPYYSCDLMGSPGPLKPLRDICLTSGPGVPPSLLRCPAAPRTWAVGRRLAQCLVKTSSAISRWN